MEWLRWRWRCWRAEHWEWVAYMGYQRSGSHDDYERWVRARGRTDQIHLDRPPHLEQHREQPHGETN